MAIAATVHKPQTLSEAEYKLLRPFTKLCVYICVNGKDKLHTIIIWLHLTRERQCKLYLPYTSSFPEVNYLRLLWINILAAVSFLSLYMTTRQTVSLNNSFNSLEIYLISVTRNTSCMFLETNVIYLNKLNWVCCKNVYICCLVVRIGGWKPKASTGSFKRLCRRIWIWCSVWWSHQLP